MQWKSREMCFAMSVHRENKTKNTDSWRFNFTYFSCITHDSRQVHGVCELLALTWNLPVTGEFTKDQWCARLFIAKFIVLAYFV